MPQACKKINNFFSKGYSETNALQLSLLLNFMVEDDDGNDDFAKHSCIIQIYTEARVTTNFI